MNNCVNVLICHFGDGPRELDILMLLLVNYRNVNRLFRYVGIKDLIRLMRSSELHRPCNFNTCLDRIESLLLQC